MFVAMSCVSFFSSGLQQLPSPQGAAAAKPFSSLSFLVSRLTGSTAALTFEGLSVYPNARPRLAWRRSELCRCFGVGFVVAGVFFFGF